MSPGDKPRLIAGRRPTTSNVLQGDDPSGNSNGLVFCGQLEPSLRKGGGLVDPSLRKTGGRVDAPAEGWWGELRDTALCVFGDRSLRSIPARTSRSPIPRSRAAFVTPVKASCRSARR